MPEPQILSVGLYNKPIGTLTLLNQDRSIFAFNDPYIEDQDRPTLSLSFKDEFGGLLTRTRPTQMSLAPFFSNLLPEGHLRDYLAARAGVSPAREFHLLRALGRDLPGAVTVGPLGAAAEPDSIDPPAEAQKRNAPLRFSLAGVQLKFSAIYEARGGLTIPVDGAGGGWIIKLPSTRFKRLPENELSMMTLARLTGIDVPDHRLVEGRDIAGLPRDIGTLSEPAFVTQRFDRTQTGDRIHMEDFAQVFGVYPAKKYEKATYRSIAKILWIETGPAGVAEFIRRLVFNTLIGNADMHLKNWSLIYRDRRTASLAPAYDFVSTIAYLDDDFAALKYARTKKMAELSLDELSYLAAKAGLPKTLVLKTARETVVRFSDVWRQEKAHLPLNGHAVETIDTHMRKVTLVGEV